MAQFHSQRNESIADATAAAAAAAAFNSMRFDLFITCR